jgi:hypothetical protein
MEDMKRIEPAGASTAYLIRHLIYISAHAYEQMPYILLYLLPSALLLFTDRTTR